MLRPRGVSSHDLAYGPVARDDISLKRLCNREVLLSLSALAKISKTDPHPERLLSDEICLSSRERLGRAYFAVRNLPALFSWCLISKVRYVSNFRIQCKVTVKFDKSMIICRTLL